MMMDVSKRAWVDGCRLRGDGKLDIFKTNFSDDTSTLYRNKGNGTFDDVTFAAGWAYIHGIWAGEPCFGF